MNTVCGLDKCAGCMACISVCPKNAIEIVDSIKTYNAVINNDLCVGCGQCRNICQKNLVPPLQKPESWYQGWCCDNEIRAHSSSGGFATAIAKAFVDNGGVVCSCRFQNGAFRFGFAYDAVEVYRFTGSKYVKSNPDGVYPVIRKELSKGKKVLFMGLPCQAAAVRKSIPSALQKNLYLVDLICHGTPSPKLLNLFVEQNGRSLRGAKDVLFRLKGKMQFHIDGKGIVPRGVSDKYTIAFLNGLTYTDNCYSCDYARIERVSDLTLGDSWGSDLPREELRKGVSLALCQNDKGRELLMSSNLKLLDVDLEAAIHHNHQLKSPSAAPESRERFFKQIGHAKISRLIFRSFPKQCLKQDAKSMLLKLHLIK